MSRPRNKLATRPMFIPLKREWYEAFARGEKTVEYRLPKGAFAPHHCAPGRPVVLSLGWSGNGRLNARIVAYALVDATPVTRTIWPDADTVGAITLELLD